MGVTVDSLILRAMSVADMPQSSFITTVDKHDAVNEGYRFAYDLLLNSDDDYFLTSLSASVTSEYSLPSDFMRVRAVDVDDNGTFTEVKKFSVNQRNMLQNTGSNRPYYRIVGSKLYVIPQGNAYTLRIWYYPKSSVLVGSSVIAWGTTTAYKIGDMISNSGTYYQCLVAHTSGTFATDLAAGKWTAYSTTAESIALITYPNNLVHEIISYGAAIKFKSKARELDKIPLLAEQRNEFIMQFKSQIVRDDANFERVQIQSEGGIQWL